MNPDPSPVCARLASLGLREHQIGHVDDGERCVEQFVGRYRDQQTEAVVEGLHQLGSTLAGGTLLLSWGNSDGLLPSRVQPVMSISDPDPHTGELALTLAGGGVPVTPEPSQLSDLLSRLPAAHSLVGITAEGRRLPIVDLWSRLQPDGETLRWVSLVPSGVPGFD
jgi:hypothetical protein